MATISEETAPKVASRPHAPLVEFYSDPAQRPDYIASLFDHSAPYYDWISKVMAFGTDRFYRRQALRKAGLTREMRLLDVATGTGLVAQAALENGLQATNIVGVDPSWGMLGNNKTGILLLRGYGESLPFQPNTFDFVSMGYALRHVESLPRLFAEFRRVLKPGGRVLVLEISKPPSKVMARLLKFYMRSVLPALAQLRGSSHLAELLRYYWATIEECVPPERIVAALQASGFHKVERRSFGPILNDYFAQK